MKEILLWGDVRKHRKVPAAARVSDGDGVQRKTCQDRSAGVQSPVDLLGEK